MQSAERPRRALKFSTDSRLPFDTVRFHPWFELVHRMLQSLDESIRLAKN